MKKIKGIKGITLIALVITIIVMLILVGVTINVVLNGNLIENTSDAKNRQALERDKELLYVAALGCMENGKVIFTGDEGLENHLPNEFEKTNKTGKYKKGNNTFYVDENGGVSTEDNNIDFDAIKESLKDEEIRNKYLEEAIALGQSEEIEDIGIGTDGKVVNLSLWTYGYVNSMWTSDARKFKTRYFIKWK